jgi:hypothetical protein
MSCASPQSYITICRLFLNYGLCNNESNDIRLLDEGLVVSISSPSPSSSSTTVKAVRISRCRQRMSFVLPNFFDKGKVPCVSSTGIIASNCALRVVRRMAEKEAPNEFPDAQIQAMPTMTTIVETRMPSP